MFDFFRRVKGYRQWQLGWHSPKFSLYTEFHGYPHGLGANLSFEPASEFDGKWYLTGFVSLRVNTGYGGFDLACSWASDAYLRKVLQWDEPPGGDSPY